MAIMTQWSSETRAGLIKIDARGRQETSVHEEIARDEDHVEEALPASMIQRVCENKPEQGIGDVDGSIMSHEDSVGRKAKEQGREAHASRDCAFRPRVPLTARRSRLSTFIDSEVICPFLLPLPIIRQLLAIPDRS